MSLFKLINRANHLFIELDDELWLLDTGSPASIGEEESLIFMGEEFELDSEFSGCNPAMLSGYLGVDIKGLIGANLLGSFDWFFDCQNQQLKVSKGSLALAGNPVALQFLMGIPIATIGLGADFHRVFVDTGAQITYLHESCYEGSNAVDDLVDFYPGIGDFTTPIYPIDMAIGNGQYPARGGVLPELLQASLLVGGAAGILGNELFLENPIGYFPRRSQLVIA